MGVRKISAAVAAAAVAAPVWWAAPASAATAPELVSAIVGDPAVVASSTLTEPSGADGGSVAVRTDAVAGFPTQPGGSYAVLSTGRADQLTADAASTRASTGWSASEVRPSIFDVTTLTVTLDVPAGANCLLGVDFRFLSEEYPEYVGDSFNDAFIAEAGTSDWSIDAGGTIVAPHNFAFDSSGRVISINAGLFGDGDPVAEAAGTIFNGASPMLTAAAPLTGGTQETLYFTVFDQGDSGYDSAVMIDNLRVGTVDDPATDCRPGAQTAPTLVVVSASAPTTVDTYGTADDTYTIPSVTGVQYSVGGHPVAPGTYPATGTVVVTASALEGFELTGPSKFTLTFTDVVRVTATAPTAVDRPGTAHDRVTIPAVPGVTYLVGGKPVASGPLAVSGDVVVTVQASGPGYVLAGPTTFTLHLSADDVPAAPTVALTAGPGSVDVSWDVPQGTPTGYEVEQSTDGRTWTRVVRTATTSTHVTGLPGGRPVTFRVRATNDLGTGAWSTPVAATPTGPAAAPTVTRVEAGSRTLTVSFDAPERDGGTPVTGYEYSLDGGPWTAVAASPLRLTGLVNGTSHQVRVRAVTEVGPGAASAAAAGVPAAAPVLVGDGSGPAARPELAPTQTRAWVDGAPVDVDVSVSADGQRVVRGAGFGVALGAVDQHGTRLPVDTQGRVVADRGGLVTVAGTGFAPGELVDVWLFSQPVLLGSVPVGVDGTFVARLPLPAGIAVGEHTVQLNGTTADGTLASVATGLVVRAAVADGPAAGALAATGSSTGPVALLGLWLLLAGAVAVVVAHRRTRRA